MPISRISFQIYLDGKIPEEQYQSHVSLKRAFKEYDYRIYNDEDTRALLDSHLPRYSEVYEKSDDITKKAIACYAWMYHHGGIHLDPDLVIRSNEAKYITDHSDIYLLQASYPTRRLTPHMMASCERSEFWINVLDYILIGEREAPAWAYDLDPESMTAHKNFDTLYAGEPLDRAYYERGHHYNITVLDYGTLKSERYLHSIKTFKNKNPAAWRHVDWTKWIYIICVVLVIIFVIILIALWYYESWRIGKKAKNTYDQQCRESLNRQEFRRSRRELIC